MSLNNRTYKHKNDDAELVNREVNKYMTKIKSLKMLQKCAL